jgi:hypothetical protein
VSSSGGMCRPELLESRFQLYLNCSGDVHAKSTIATWKNVDNVWTFSTRFCGFNTSRIRQSFNCGMTKNTNNLPETFPRKNGLETSHNHGS